MKRTAVLVVVVLGAVAAAALAAGGPWNTTPGFPGGKWLGLPPLHPDGDKWPLLFALHGWGGEANSYGRQWHEALGGTFLVVAPQGLVKTRGGKGVSTWGRATDDRAYLTAVWDEVHKRYKIDPARTVVAGYSAGGVAASVILKERSEQIAAVVFHALKPDVDAAAVKGKHIFLLGGEQDGSLNATRGGAFRDELFTKGADVVLYIAPGATHASVYAKIQEPAKWIRAGFKTN
jgi:predicted esterase